MKVLLIRNDFEDSQIIVEMLRSMLGNIKTTEYPSYLAVFYTYDNDEDIIHVLNALETELVGNIHAYLSSDKTEERLKKEVEIGIGLLEDLPIGIYTMKQALLHSKTIKDKKKILAFILEQTGVNEDFIREFAENDLNVSQASKAMFIHRNTLIYKINKLKASSGFELTNFKDAFILYSLLENK